PAEGEGEEVAGDGELAAAVRGGAADGAGAGAFAEVAVALAEPGPGRDVQVPGERGQVGGWDPGERGVVQDGGGDAARAGRAGRAGDWPGGGAGGRAGPCSSIRRGRCPVPGRGPRGISS